MVPITRSQKPKMMDVNDDTSDLMNPEIESSPDEVKEMATTENPARNIIIPRINIPTFKEDGELTIKDWILIFETLTIDYAEMRPKILLQYSGINILKFLVQYKLSEKDWPTIKTHLEHYFGTNKTSDFSQLREIKFEKYGNIEKYFRAVLDISVDLNLANDFIINVLTTGLPPELRIFGTDKEFKQPYDWLNFYQKKFEQQVKIKEEKSASSRKTSIVSNSQPKLSQATFTPRVYSRNNHSPRFPRYPARPFHPAPMRYAQPPQFPRPYLPRGENYFQRSPYRGPRHYNNYISDESGNKKIEPAKQTELNLKQEQ